MPILHIVKQGEHLPGIAHEYGFSDWHTIWNDAANAALKEKRKNPNVLYPGDQLQIPDIHEKHLQRNVDKRHRFRVHELPLRLRVILERQYHKPLASLLGRWYIASEGRPVMTDDSGKIDRPIAKDAKQVDVVLDEEIPGKTGPVVVQHEFTFLVGHLDPVDKASGQRARLLNLGYYQGRFDRRMRRYSQPRWKSSSASTDWWSMANADRLPRRS